MSKSEPDPVPGSGDEKEDEDLDGVPLDGAALLKSALMRGIPGLATSDSPIADNNSRIPENTADSDYDDDIDGIPCKHFSSFKTIPTFFICLFEFVCSGWHWWRSDRQNK